MVIAAINALTTFLANNPFYHHAPTTPSDAHMRSPASERLDGS